MRAAESGTILAPICSVEHSAGEQVVNAVTTPYLLEVQPANGERREMETKAEIARRWLRTS